MIKSLNDSVSNLKKMVDELVSQEKLLKNLCHQRGIQVPGLVDVEKMDFFYTHFNEDESYDEEDEEDYEDDEYLEDEDPHAEEQIPSLVKSTGLTTPITSPNDSASETNYSFREAIIINNDNTPILASLDDEIPIKQDVSLSPYLSQARPIKTT